MGFKVRELLFSNGKFQDTKGKKDLNFKHKKYDQNNIIKGKITCRICLEDREDIDGL